MSRPDRRLILGAATSLALTGRAMAADSPVAETRTGKVRGLIDQGISVFKAIPYGQDTAPVRFMPPVAAKPWSGIRDCLSFGARAPQAGGVSRFTPETELAISEDCLKLNVWTPALDHRKRPVMVYIHGGGYSGGSANCPYYDGVNLCRKGDVVVVTLNHRLNAFGHLYLAELGGERFADSGNVGMLDLVLALRWVRDNIAGFGGDAANVMIFGQSGGGGKASVLMAMPQASGLFHKVWTMSGQQVTATPAAMATESARKVLVAAKLTPDQLRMTPMAELVRLSRAASYYGPVLDGRSVPRDPFEPDATPLSRRIPLVMGNTREETTTLIGAGDPSTFTLTWEQLPAKIDQHIASYIRPYTAEQVIAKYRSLYPAYGPSDIFFAASAAGRSWRAQVIQAERRAAQPSGSAPTYVYQFDWRSPVDGGKWRAGHMSDIPMVFDNTAIAADTTGGGAGARAMAELVSSAAIAFARTGNPNAKGLPDWPAYDLKRRATMMFDTPSQIADDPRGEERRYFAALTYRQPGT